MDRSPETSSNSGNSEISIERVGRRIPFAWMAGLTVSFAAIPIAMSFERFGFQYLSHKDLPGDVEKAIALSEFFAHGFGVAVVLIAILVLFPDQRRKLPRMICCIFASGTLANLLKLGKARVRPIASTEESNGTWQGSWGSWFPEPETYDYAIQSFPSAHTATAFALALSLTWLYPRGRLFYFTLASLAALQRIVSLAHWPSDVAAGVLVAVAVGLLILAPSPIDRLFSKLERTPPVHKKYD